MKHPFEVLRPEYAQLLSAMAVRPDSKKKIDDAAVRLLGYRTRYEPVTAANGVPVVFIATSFEREASSNFAKNPAQGWPLTSISKIIPRNGPFRTWHAAAVEAYHLNGLDKVGAANWTWELFCFYGEMFNGFGYRDYHSMHTPYLWGGTNIQTRGKYVEDGKFDAAHMDEQIGIVPVARRMVEIEPTLALGGAVLIPPPAKSGIVAEDTGVDVKFVQDAMNRLGWQPELKVDGNYGEKTSKAVQHFQKSFGMKVDFAGPETVEALHAAIKAIEESKND